MRAGRRFRVPLRLRCAAAECRGTATLALGGKRGPAEPIRLAAGRAATVRLALTKPQRRALRRTRVLKARLAVTPSGVKRSFTLALRAPKAR